MGSRDLDTYIATHGTGPSRELDRICSQIDAHTALLYWHTDLGAASAEARRTRRPILSLRLLGRIAATKQVLEAPLLRSVAMDLDADSQRNLELHDRIHEAFAQRAEWKGVDGFVEWVYAELFQMPLDDAALGLDVPDPFSAVA